MSVERDDQKDKTHRVKGVAVARKLFWINKGFGEAGNKEMFV